MVRMLAAAFPLASWTQASEAVYVMALADDGVDPDTARAAVRKLVREADRLPTIHRLLMACRAVSDEAVAEEFLDGPVISEEDRRIVRDAAMRMVKHLTTGCDLNRQTPHQKTSETQGAST